MQARSPRDNRIRIVGDAEDSNRSNASNSSNPSHVREVDKNPDRPRSVYELPPGVRLRGGFVFNGSTWDPSLFSKAAQIELLEKRKRGVLTEWYYAAPWGQPRRADLTEIYQLSQSAWARMCITTIIAEVAMVDWDIVPTNLDMANTARVKAKIDEVKRFLESPNPNDESFETLLRKVLFDILVYDAGIIVKVFDKGSYGDEPVILKSADSEDRLVVKAPLVLNKPRRRLVEIHAQNGASFLKHVDRNGIVHGYFQYSYAQPAAQPEFFTDHEVVYFMQNPIPGSCYGWSALQSISSILKSLIYSAQFNQTYFEENEIPSGILSITDISEPEWDRFKAYWDTEVKGKHHKFPLVDKEVKFQPFILTHREMQFIESTKWYQQIVMANYHVTQMELGLVEQGAQMTARESSLVFRRKAIYPLLKLLERRINDEIVSEFDPLDEVEFKFNPVDLDEWRFKMDIIERELRSGVKTINEVRKDQGLDPVPWGDKPMWLQRQEQPSSPFGQYFPPATVTPPLLPRQPQEATVEAASDSSAAKALTTSAPVAVNGEEVVTAEPVQPELPELPPDNFYKIPNAPHSAEDPRVIELTALEEEFQKELRQLFSRQKREIAAFLKEEKMPDFDIIKFADWEAVAKALQKLSTVHLKELVKLVKRFLRQSVQAGGEKAYSELMVTSDFELQDPQAVAYLADAAEFWAAEKYGGIREQVRQTLMEGIEKGESIDKLTDRINAIYNPLEVQNAEVIARTETVRAANYGREVGYTQSGLVEGKQWVVTYDDRTCEECRRMANKIVKLNDNFFSTLFGYVQNPPLHPRCRCTIVPVLKKNVELSAQGALVKTVKMLEIEEKFGKPLETLLPEMYKAKEMSYREIAEEFGMTKPGVKRWIDLFGIEPRPPSVWKKR